MGTWFLSLLSNIPRPRAILFHALVLSFRMDMLSSFGEREEKRGRKDLRTGREGRKAGLLGIWEFNRHLVTSILSIAIVCARGELFLLLYNVVMLGMFLLI